MTEDTTGAGISRRWLGSGALALGGAFALSPASFADAATVGGAGAEGEPLDGPGALPGQGPTLRRGTPGRAGLIGAHLEQLVTEAEAFLRPSPRKPWYAGAVLLAGRGGTVALHRPIGMAVRYSGYDEKSDTGIELPAERQIPMAEDTVFDLASVSKLFTSLLAVQRIERGELKLDDTVASHVPEFAAAGKQEITVLQVLTHTSGLRPWIPFHREPTREGMLRLLWQEAPVSPPGVTYLYSDLNLIALQLVLERITGRSLDVLLREDITAPLGMQRTRFNPPPSWKPKIAATEDSRPPWSGLDRGLVWGEVHDENAFAFGGVAGHAGVFSCAWDLAVLARTLLNGGSYGTARILRPESVELMFTDANTEFPGNAHGLGFELYQHWYMGAMATPRSAGHTGFTGTSLVLDPSTDSFLIVLGNSVHPVRTWRSGSAPRVATADRLARAVAVRPRRGRTAWFSGLANASDVTLTLPALPVESSTRLVSSVWWDIAPGADRLLLEASNDDGVTWRPVPFDTVRLGARQPAGHHPDGSAGGWSERVWHRLTADLAPWRETTVRVRWRYTTDSRLVGRGVYVDAIRVEDRGRTVFDERRSTDLARIEAVGWIASLD
ncbi:serine hydrolase [Streptomyces sp. NPDC005963]|uniref:serine hydrolase n=1 Tax=Streptomyces sp. NPDC005963 TaxID=3156721 RepID=UPI0033D29DB2